jgi:N-methylhydantoinase A
VAPLDRLDLDAVNRLYAEMAEHGTRWTRAGARRRELQYIRTCDLRYVGQGHDITVAVSRGRLTAPSLATVRQSFERLYEKLFRRRLSAAIPSWPPPPFRPPPRALRGRPGPGAAPEGLVVSA